MQKPGLDSAEGTHNPPSDEEVRAELDRILSSPLLDRGGKRRDFLRYIVEETLEGRTDNLKGYTIAVDVFDRADTFDGATDPVVRLEARRLRRDLDSYYFDAGRDDPLRISIPKGAYVPRFEWRETTQTPASGTDEPQPAEPREAAPRDGSLERRFHREAWIGALGIALVAIIAAGWALSTWLASPSPVSEREPAVAVLPFETLSDSGDGRYIAAGITQQLVGDLMRFPGFRIYSLPVGVEGSRDAPVLLGKELGVTYIVSGSVQELSQHARLSVQVLDADSGRVVWSNTYDRDLDPVDLIAVQDDLAARLATEIGEPYGVVTDDLARRASTPEVSNMQSYVCVLRAHTFRRSFARAEFYPLLECLQDSVRRDPDYSDAWAMLGYAYMYAGVFRYLDDVEPAEYYARAVEAASRALALEPNNTLPLKVLSATNHYIGNFGESERFARLALEQNPHDPDVLVQLGWRLAIRGNFDEGVPLIERAIARSANPPGWYFHLLAVDRLMKDDGAGMLDAAKHAAADGSALSQSFAAMAESLLGDDEAAKDALRRMNELSPGYNPIRTYRNHRATEEILDAMTAALGRAGWDAEGRRR